MEVKGTAVKSIPEYIRAKYPERIMEWLDSLPPASRKIMDGVIVTNNWYPLREGLTIPVAQAGKLFFGSETKGAWDMGRYSADLALTGVYKLYVKFGTPKHIIERANRVFSAYFTPSEISTQASTKNSFTFRITKFDQIDPVVEHNIAGWMERALEISGCSSVNVQIPFSLSQHHKFTEFQLSWG